MTRHAPYSRRITETRKRLGNVAIRNSRYSGRGGRPSWHSSHSYEKKRNNNIELPAMNKAPPKLIKTVRLDESGRECSPSSVNQTASDMASASCSSNICSSWLAKNHQKKGKKSEEIIVEDSESNQLEENVEADVFVLKQTLNPPAEKQMAAVKLTPKDDFRDLFIAVPEAEDGIFIIEEFPARRSRMTQLETNMETFWSAPTSSSYSATKPTTCSCTASKTIVTEVHDGFSRDCTDFQRMPRCWDKVRPLSKSQINSSPSSQFTVCSYNVLCQKTIARTTYLYRHLRNSSQFLNWDYRWKILQKELPTFNADIFGLQEVQSDHYREHFEPFMMSHGYEGVYKRKHGTQQKDDGCALFYRSSKFEKIGYQEVNYFISPSAISNRENIAQVIALRCNVTREIILIANTHLLFNEERGDVKLAQLAILFASIHKMRIGFAPLNPPVLMMGDFNMEPNSKVYEFVVNGQLLIDGQAVRTMSGQTRRAGGRLCSAAELLFQSTVSLNSMFQDGNFQTQPVFDGHIRHPFNFLSAYHQGFPFTIPHEKRCITTYHKTAASPDFIFYTPEGTKNGKYKLQLTEKYSLPTFDTLSNATPWPNKNVPSDHIPIMAKFQLLQDS